MILSGDTIHGKVKIIDFMDGYYDYQRQVSFRDQKNATQYTPDELASFSYEDKNDMVTLQSVSSPEGDGHIFLRRYYTGACKVYGMTISEIKGSTDMGPGKGDGLIHSSLIPSEHKYIQIGGSQFYLLKRVNFKRNMKEIFASCPHILSGLDSRQYTYENLQALVNDYNSGRR